MKPHIFRSAVFFVLFIGTISHAQTWQPIASMHDKRVEACSVTLRDGRVLIAGGHDDNAALASTEIYDPRTNKWQSAAPMNEPRWRYAMILIADGCVMVAGGLTDMGRATTSGVEIYDPRSDTWTQMTSMSNPRENLPLLLLPDSTIFVCGGLDANIPQYLASAEIFDPRTNTFKQCAQMKIAVFGPKIFYDSIHNEVLLQGGSYNGLGGTYPPILQIYNFATNTWRNGPQSATSHDSAPNHVEMPDGTIVCIGGRTASFECTDSIEILPPPYTTWSFVGRLTSKRWQGVSVLCGDSVLVIGGDNVPGTNPGTHVFDSTNWFLVKEHKTSQGPRMIHHRGRFCATVTNLPESPCEYHQIVFAFGGVSQGGRSLDSCEMLDLGFKGNGGTGNVSQHLAVRSGVVGDVIDMPLAVDLLDTAGVRTMWPNLKSVSGTFSYDSSRVYFNSIVPAVGWSLASVNDNGKNVQFTVKNQSAAYAMPLDVASAEFKIHDTTKGMTRVILNDLTLHTTTDQTLCLSQTEDALWGIVVKPLASVDQELGYGIGMVRAAPNPFADHIRITGDVESIVVYDLLGHQMDLAMSKELSGFDIATKSLAIGTYFVVCKTPEGMKTIRVVK